MEHLNYCRQMIKQFAAKISIPNFREESRAILRHAIDLANASQKFLLIDGGRLYDDPEYRALDDSQPLNLPYPFIALEYARPTASKFDKEDWQEGDIVSSKVIVFARQRDDYIVITPVIWVDHEGIWGPMPEVAIPRVGYLDRSISIRGYTGLKLSSQNEWLPHRDYADEVGALLCFLNVLQCRNVHTERSEPKKSGKKIKSALPFDSYHILTVDAHNGSGSGTATGGHRSPREHLRRGHIRRLADGRRIWVNATVVAAGRGAGVVTKDYAVRRFA